MEAERCFTNVFPEDFRETEVPGKLDTFCSRDICRQGEQRGKGESDPGVHNHHGDVYQQICIKKSLSGHLGLGRVLSSNQGPVISLLTYLRPRVIAPASNPFLPSFLPSLPSD